MSTYAVLIWTINLIICLLPPLYTFWFFIDRRYYTGAPEVNLTLCMMSLAFCWNVTTILVQDPNQLQWDYTFGRIMFFAAFLFVIQVIKHCHRDKDKHECNLNAGEQP